MKPFLLVDDRHEILSLLKWEMGELGVLSMQADNAEDAIELLSEIEFEAIFLDIVLGPDSSSSVLTYLKSPANEFNQDIKIILMSGLIDKDFSKKHIDKFYKIVEKPFEENEIVNIVTEIKSQSK